MNKKILILFSILLLSVAVSGADIDRLLKVNNDYSYSPSNPYVGDVITLNASIENVGNRNAATGIKAELFLNGNYFESIDIVEEIESIPPGQTAPIFFQYKIKDNAYTGIYKYNINLSFFNGQQDIEYTYDLNLFVTECYVLDIENISLDNYAPHIGERFNVSAKVKNTCFNNVRDVIVELEPVTNSTFDPFILRSSSTIRLPLIGPGESKQVSFSLQPGENTDPGLYVFSIGANCVDCTQVYSNNFSFEAKGEPALIFSGIEISVNSPLGDKRIMQGMPFSLSVQLDNIGTETAKKIAVNIDVDGGITGVTESYIGNLDEDDSGAAIFDLDTSLFAESGEHVATITVSYLDEMGEPQEFSQPYTIYVAEQPPTSPLIWILILILLIVVLVIAYFIIKMVLRQLAIIKSQSR